MFIPNSFNSRVQVILANGGKVARVSYNPKAPGSRHELVGNMDSTNEVAVLRTVAFSLGQFAEKGFDGEALIIVPGGINPETQKMSGPILRLWEIQKLLKNNGEASEIIKDWMLTDENAELVEAIEELVDAMATCEARLQFTTVRDAKYIDIELNGNELTDGVFLQFKDGVASSYVTMEESNGKFIVTSEPVALETAVKAAYRINSTLKLNLRGTLPVVERAMFRDVADVHLAISLCKKLAPKATLVESVVRTGTDDF